jgi:hypothetical protein
VGAVARLGGLTVSGIALGAALSACSGGAVTVEAPTPETADRAPCRELLGALPDSVADQQRRSTDPEDAWGAAWGDPPIVLACGVEAPRSYDETATCTTVNGVDWFFPENLLDGEGRGDLTLTTVNREPYVELRLPVDYWPPATALADLSDTVRRTTDATGSCS